MITSVIAVIAITLSLWFIAIEPEKSYKMWDRFIEIFNRVGNRIIEIIRR